MRWLIAGIVIVGIFIAAGGLSRLGGGTPVDVVAVRSGPVRAVIDEQARTRLPIVTRITMPYEGRIAPIELEVGDPVEAEQMVARLVPEDLDRRLQQSKARVARLEASLRENDDRRVEEITLQQAISFVASMADTVKAAAARRTSGKARHEYAQKRLERVERLFERGAETEDELDKARLEEVSSGVDYDQDNLVHSAVVAMQTATDLMPNLIRRQMERKDLTHDVLAEELAEARAALAQAEVEHRRGTLVAPAAGLVLARPVQNERILTAGTLLLEIGQLSQLELEAEILSQEVGRIEVGDRVEIYGPAIGPLGATGRVARIYPAGFTKISSLGVEQQRVLVIVAFEPNELERLRREQNLGVDYRARVRIVTEQKEEALVLPRTALLRAPGGRWQVFAVRRGRARIETVEVGLMGEEVAEVTGGLAEGDLVVLAPESALEEGTRVRAREVERDGLR